VSRIPRCRPLVVAGLLSFLIAGGAFAAPAERYDAYHQLSEVEAQLKAWAREHPQRVTLLSAGASAGDHPIHVVRLADPGAVSPEERPGVFVGANVAGFHNAGTEAALDLVRTLVENADGEASELLSTLTFYVAPVLNPDAHDALFAAVRVRRSGNAMRLDRDRDGFEAEDGYDDLNGDGRITKMRIPDPAGEWLPHPDDPRLMVKQDSTKGWVGSHRLLPEGRDDDGDGLYNEDPAEGIAVDNNFPHAFPYPDPGAGPWASYAPATKAILDFLFARPQVALAVVYGPANNLLALPQNLGEGADLGTQTFNLPPDIAEYLGLDPEQEYTIDEVWEVAEDTPFVRQSGITKEQAAQFLGAGPAIKLEDEDRALLERLAEPYKQRLTAAGLDPKRPAEQYAAGGMTPWLYYHYGALALELDVWGIPQAKQGEEGDGEATEGLSVDRLEKMSAEEFLALDEETITAFLKTSGAPPEVTAATLIQSVRAGEMTPSQMAGMAGQQGGGGGSGGDSSSQRPLSILAWLDEHDPEGFSPWTEVRLPDGAVAEVGGFDPFLEIAPPMEILKPALRVHTETVLDLAGKLARLEIVSLRLRDLGGGVYRVEAVAANRGELATHTKMAVRARARLPVRLELETGDGVELVTGYRTRSAERLDAHTGTLRGEWLVRARRGAAIRVRVLCEIAHGDQKTHTVAQGASR